MSIRRPWATLLALAMLHGTLWAAPDRPGNELAARKPRTATPAAEAAASALPVDERRIKVLEIRRAAGTWTWVLRQPGGGYATLDASGPRRPLLIAAAAAGASAAAVGTASAVAASGSAAAQNAAGVGSAAHLDATLGAHPPIRAAILLVSLEEVATSRSVLDAAMRKLEAELGFPIYSARFELPNPPPHNPWGWPSSTERSNATSNNNDFLLAHLTSLPELEAKLASGAVEDRRLTVALLNKIRHSVSDRYLMRAFSDEDEAVRNAALKSFEQRGTEVIPALRVAAAAPTAGGALKDVLLRLEYEAAVRADEAGAYADFLARYPQSRHETEMRYRLAQARGDAAALRQMRAGFVGQGRMLDVVDALSERWIEASFSGGGIESVRARLRRVVANPISIRIPAGSYFVAGNPANQNMVTTGELTVQLLADGWQEVAVPAACANLPKAVPDGREQFTLERVPPQSQLLRLIEVLNAAKVEFAVRQAAVWIVTDNASYADLGKLRTRASRRVISEDDAAQAMWHAASAGVALPGHAIWRDRADVLAGLKDARLRQWLELSMTK